LEDSAKTPITTIAERVKAFVDELPSLEDLKLDESAIISLNKIIETTQRLTATLIEAVKTHTSAASKAASEALAEKATAPQPAQPSLRSTANFPNSIPA
jgi:hypothetical protein